MFNLNSMSAKNAALWSIHDMFKALGGTNAFGGFANGTPGLGQGWRVVRVGEYKTKDRQHYHHKTKKPTAFTYHTVPHFRAYPVSRSKYNPVECRKAGKR